MSLDDFMSEDSTGGTKKGLVDLGRFEVLRRMPHIKKINDPEIQDEVIELTSESPEYFWKVPASTSGYHHRICRKTHGLWAHTLMGATALERLMDSRCEMGLISEDEKDLARAAVILHDQRKNGNPMAPSNSSTSDHDLRMSRVVKTESDLPYEVSAAIKTHMGAWYDGPEPKTELQRVVHDADMIASTNDITAKIYGSVPDELAEIGVKSVN